MAVKLTENAAREIKSIIKQQELEGDKVRLRVGVKGGGCSGFNYILDLTEAARDSDEVWEFEFAEDDGENDKADAAASGDAKRFSITVVCDPKSYLYLNGTEIDFKDEMMGRGFVFNNPNATATCGCGSSFAV